VYTAWEWSPDGRELLYEVRNRTVECEWMNEPPGLFVYSMATGVSRKVPDIAALHAEWYGDHLLESVCVDWPVEEPILDRWGDERFGCRHAGAGESPGDVFVGGQRVAGWPTTGSPSAGLGIDPV